MAKTPVDYRYQGPFDRTIFRAEFDTQFKKNGHYNAAAIPDMLELVGMIERDPMITDVRWAAYMLATSFKETVSPTLRQYPLKKNGKVVTDPATGQPKMRNTYPWLMQMRPVDEVGKGEDRDYAEAVKIMRLPDGRVRVTEQDGDQFAVAAIGHFSVLKKGPLVLFPAAKVGAKFEGGGIMGTKQGGAAHTVYAEDEGTEIAYFGRGYVQLTWWKNYAAAGARLGRGLDFVLNPELVKDTAIAYRLMSDGMCLGKGFSNGKTFSMYFTGQSRNYVGARAMVNGVNCAAEIAKYAEAFEAALLASRIK